MQQTRSVALTAVKPHASNHHARVIADVSRCTLRRKSMLSRSDRPVVTVSRIAKDS